MKKVILIITGSIAAPKALDLFNLLKEKYLVTVLITPSARKFIKFPDNFIVHDDFLDQEFYQRDDEINHIEFATKNDLIIVYPATMTFISKAALGICDNLPLATFFASKMPKIIFPAMNHNMYHNQALQRNIELLKQDFQVLVTKPDYGLLATRIKGDGRLKEPIEAFALIQGYEKQTTELVGKTVLINYGASRAYLDDLRYITNGSSGKMGQGLVQAFLARNAKVIAVVGDVSVPLLNDENLTVVRANTNQTVAAEMNKYFSQVDIVICAAALNDYQVDQPWTGKISKTENETLQVNLVSNLDVLANLGKNKTKQLLIGFSAQSNLDETIAQRKMQEKNCDGIIMNNINVINQEETQVIFYFKNNSYQFMGSKIEVANEIVKVISSSFG